MINNNISAKRSRQQNDLRSQLKSRMKTIEMYSNIDFNKPRGRAKGTMSVSISLFIDIRLWEVKENHILIVVVKQ